MIAEFYFEDLLEATDAEVIREPQKEIEAFTISTDTRSITSNNLYLPLVGEKFDGHNFINEAINKGAVGCIVNKDYDCTKIKSKTAFIVRVDDTLIALLSLANFHRMNTDAIVIAITGSSGKTTTKELLATVLSEKFNVLKSKLNYNNEIGVSKTLLDIEDDTEIVIVEMGMRGLKEIDLLAKYALPDISIITNVGTSHIGRLGSIDNIAKAKTEILNYLDKKTGLALLYADDALLLNHSEKYKGEKILFGSKDTSKLLECSGDKMLFEYKGESYSLPIPGNHNIINSSIVIEVGKYLEMDYQDIYNGLKNYQPIFGRWEEHDLFEGSKLINDAYNANPDSMKAAIDAAIAMYNNKALWLVLGDMLELGSYETSMHEDIGKWLQNKNVERLYTVGNLASNISKELKDKQVDIIVCQTVEEVSSDIKAKKPVNTVILLKASRSVGLDRIVETLV